MIDTLFRKQGEKSTSRGGRHFFYHEVVERRLYHLALDDIVVLQAIPVFEVVEVRLVDKDEVNAFTDRQLEFAIRADQVRAIQPTRKAGVFHIRLLGLRAVRLPLVVPLFVDNVPVLTLRKRS